MGNHVTTFLAELLMVLQKDGYSGFVDVVNRVWGAPWFQGVRQDVESRQQALQRIIQAHELQNIEEIDQILAEHNEIRTGKILEARQSEAAIEAATQMLTEESPAMHAKLLNAMRETVLDAASQNVKRPRTYATSEGKAQFQEIVDSAYSEMVLVEAVLAYFDYHQNPPS